MTDDEKKEAWSQFPADTDLVLPRRTAVELMFRDPARREQGIAQAVLFVDDIRNVKEVEDKVEAPGPAEPVGPRLHRAPAADLPAHLRRDDVRGRRWPCSSRRSGSPTRC